MLYELKIKILEEQHRLADNKLFHYEKSGSVDHEQIKKLREEKDRYLNELRHLRKLQWEQEHEHIRFEDDR